MFFFLSNGDNYGYILWYVIIRNTTLLSLICIRKSEHNYLNAYNYSKWYVFYRVLWHLHVRFHQIFQRKMTTYVWGEKKQKKIIIEMLSRLSLKSCRKALHCIEKRTGNFIASLQHLHMKHTDILVNLLENEFWDRCKNKVKIANCW